MRVQDLPLADIIANDPEAIIISDDRARSGSITVPCPNARGRGGHLLTVLNPDPASRLPALITCDADDCSGIGTAAFIALLHFRPDRSN